MYNILKFLLFIIVLIINLSTVTVVSSQDNNENPIYIVQPGENLTSIALKFNVAVQDLININSILNPDLITAGMELVIPGLDGINGYLITRPVGYGETLRSILRHYQLDIEQFIRLNSITSPSEIYIGSTLILPQSSGNDDRKNQMILGEKDSIFSASITKNMNPWIFNRINLTNSPFSVPGDALFTISEINNESVTAFSDNITKIEISPLPLIQGHTVIVYIYAKLPVELNGSIDDNPITFFFDSENGFYYALHGIHAMADPGLVPIHISGIFENSETFNSEQWVLLTSGGFSQEEISVEQTTIDLNSIEQENAAIQNIVSDISTQKYWQEKFRFPVDGSLNDNTIGFTSYFGSRRSYNNGQFSSFHGGLDFEVLLMSFNIYAPAPGVVVFAGPMNIRGNTTFIDHGQGVYSGYAHQNTFLVNVGDKVETGQLIGEIGNTGRVTGPHLHWDIWVNGIQVDPFDWIEIQYP